MKQALLSRGSKQVKENHNHRPKCFLSIVEYTNVFALATDKLHYNSNKVATSAI